MSSGGSGAVARVPSQVRKMIENIKEITGIHSEDEIYTMLKECAMDPNEAAQKLLFQDTFHEVKRKRDRKKEILNKDVTDAKWKANTQGRGGYRVGNRGNYSSHYMHTGGKNFVSGSSGKENGSSQVSEKVNTPVETHNKDISLSTTTVVNGPANVTSGDSSSVKVENSTVPGSGKLEGPLLVATPVHVRDPQKSSTGSSSLSASDPVLLPSKDSRHPGAIGTIKRETGQVKPQESKVISAPEIVNTKVQGKMVNKSEEPSQAIIRPSSNFINRSHVIGPPKGTNKEWKPKTTSSSASLVTAVPTAEVAVPASVEVNTQSVRVEGVIGSKEVEKKLEDTHISDEEQHVKIPNHIHVPETEKLGFVFGSFDATSFGLISSNNDSSREKKTEASQINEEIITPQLSSNEEDTTEKTEEVKDIPEIAQSSSSNQGESSIIIPEIPQEVVIQTSPEYPFGYLPPGAQVPPFEDHQRDASRFPNFLVPQTVDPMNYYTQFYTDTDGRKFNGNMPLMPSQTTSQTEGGNSTVTSASVGPQNMGMFRHGMHMSHYPPANFIPYPHYYSPYYHLPPGAMHQFMTSNGGFPPQPGNIYATTAPPPPAPPVTTAKYPLPQYKPSGSSGGGATPSYVGPYGNQTSSEDLVASQFKDYATGQQQSEGGTGVWIAPPGRDITGLYNNVGQGHGGGGGFGMYHQHHHHPGGQGQGQGGNGSGVHQSQTMGGPVEMVGPTHTMYQTQNQQSQINWPSNY